MLNFHSNQSGYTKVIKLMIVDDHQLFRSGLISLMNSFQDIEVLGEAGNGQELLNLLEEKQPDVILMDLNMPTMDGIEATKAVKAKYPDIKIVILTMQDEDKFIIHLIDQGANGYLLKNAHPEEMVHAIRTVVEQDQYFNQMTSQVLLNSLRDGRKKNQKPNFSNQLELTRREREVLQLICEGLSNAEISEKLFISIRTVEGHRSNLLNKTDTRNSAGLVAYAIRNNLVNVDSF